MSKLVDGLMAKALNHYRPGAAEVAEARDFSAEMCVKPMSFPLEELVEFRVEYVSQHYLRPVDINAVLAIEAKKLNDIVYGQFRRQIYDLELAVYGRDLERARMLLRDLRVLTDA